MSATAGEKVGFLDDGSAFARGIGNTSIVVFLLAMLIPVRGLSFIPSLEDVPINSLAILTMGVIGVFAASRWRIRAGLVTFTAVVLPVWLIGSTWLLHGDPALRRSLNIAALLLGGAAIASGRIHLRSLIRGLTIGLLVATLVSIALSRGGESRLSGLLGDPNQAGFVIVTIGLLALQGAKGWVYRTAIFLFVGATLVLTVSRTSMFAMLIGVAWALWGYRLPRLLGAGLLAVAIPLYTWLIGLAEDSTLFQEREGSDELRERLRGVEQFMVDDAGLIGKGLGTAIADLGDISLYFHNSYRAMWQEGGLIALILLIALLVGLFFLGGRLPADKRPAWAEAAVIAAAICSFNIGFSITHPVFAVAVGCLVAMNAANREGIDWEMQPVHIPKGTGDPVARKLRAAG